MLWAYDLYKYVYTYSAGIDFSHKATKVDPRAVRVNMIDDVSDHF